MRQTKYLFLLVVAAIAFAACDDTESYADKKDKEKAAINQLISDSDIVVISESTFKSQGNTTNVANNEYVLFETSGVYMQIVNEGCGSVLADGEEATALVRYSEYNIEEDYTIGNLNSSSAYYVDEMYVSNTSGTITANYVATATGYSYSLYGSTSVPTGLIVPLSYIKLGRPSSADEDVARVKLIVPHSAGTTTNTTYVYPCYYEVTYERGL